MTLRAPSSTLFPYTTLFRSYVVKHLSEFQSDVISEQTKKGMVKAKEKGESVGRPRKPDENVQRAIDMRSEEHTSELQSRGHLVCRLLLENKNSDNSDVKNRS